MLKRQRNHRIDLLRTIGLFSIILAHVNPPSLLLNIRSFDVTLMCVVSGMAFYISWKPERRYGEYVCGRIKKLLLPSYLLILLWFFGANILCAIIGHAPLYSFHTLRNALLLFNDGMGYVWIVKIYLILAVISPLIYKLLKKLHNDWACFSFVLAWMAVYGVLYWCYGKWELPLSETTRFFVEEYILASLGYMVAFIVGAKCVESRKFAHIMGIFSIVGFIAAQILFSPDGFAPNAYKYPPSDYYLLYGMAVTLLLFNLLPNRAGKAILWVSANSFKLYLYHVPLILATMFVKNWAIRYVIVAAGTMAAVGVWNGIRQKLIKYTQRKTTQVAVQE